jgi:hypothetical protein
MGAYPFEHITLPSGVHYVRPEKAGSRGKECLGMLDSMEEKAIKDRWDISHLGCDLGFLTKRCIRNQWNRPDMADFGSAFLIALPDVRTVTYYIGGDEHIHRYNWLNRLLNHWETVENGPESELVRQLSDEIAADWGGFHIYWGGKEDYPINWNRFPPTVLVAFRMSATARRKLFHPLFTFLSR